MATVRLQRFLARSGVASRRGSENLMTAGRVCVNGTVATELGTKIDPDVDVVTVDGVRVELQPGGVCLLLNKPAGYLSTMDDPFGRPTVAELVPTDRFPGLFPVGRLDFDTTGVLLFTTDGELSHRLLHPRWKVAKTYRAHVAHTPTEHALEPLRRGIVLDDGPCAPAEVRILTAHSSDGSVEITLKEGRKRQVKRMLSAVDLRVTQLERLRFAGFTSEGVRPGAYRILTEDECAALRRSVDLPEGEPRL